MLWMIIGGAVAIAALAWLGSNEHM